MAKFPFLSDEWMDAARAIREEYRGKAQPVGKVKLNQVITDVPGKQDPVQAFMDSSSGEMEMELGQVPDPDVTITVDYDTAKQVFVEGNPEAGMQAFMAGRIKVQGDLAKLLAMQQSNLDPTTIEIAGRIKDITA